jgi:hypothetical protein
MFHHALGMQLTIDDESTFVVNRGMYSLYAQVCIQPHEQSQNSYMSNSFILGPSMTELATNILLNALDILGGSIRRLRYEDCCTYN